MFFGSTTAILPVLCWILPFCWSKTKLTVKESINDLPKANLTRRPLNLYITANGVHVIPKNETIFTESNETITYKHAEPPFSIKTRGFILILTENPDFYVSNRPSLLQMFAASGHKTILYEINKKQDFNVENRKIEQILLKEILDRKFSVISDFTIQDWIPKWIQNQKNLEATIFIDYKKENVEKLKNLEKIPTLFLNAEKLTFDQDFLVNFQILPIKKTMDFFDIFEIMKILQNFYDLLHVR